MKDNVVKFPQQQESINDSLQLKAKSMIHINSDPKLEKDMRKSYMKLLSSQNNVDK